MRTYCLLFCACLGMAVPLRAAIIDRVAIVVASAVITDSDIDRDIRIVDFLNRETARFDLAARREAANRLVDQAIIRAEMKTGDYQGASASDADRMMQQVQRDRSQTETQFISLLRERHIAVADLRRYLLWQLTVLRFIDQRFRPAVVLTDAEVNDYVKAHGSELVRAVRADGPNAKRTVQDEARETLTGERINKAFDRWLGYRRTAAKPQYREETLQTEAQVK